jgi:heterodisulfide reductase subunit B
MRDYAMFWGCTIPARFPSIEKATRLVLDDLGMRIHELEGHTCCPEGTLVKAIDPDAYHLTAARNLAIVGRSGLDMVTPCNGCYSTFKETQRHLSADRAEVANVDRRLAREDLAWPPELQVLHLAEWLADVEGAPAVARRAVRRLAGMRVAVHYGCHLLRPQPSVSWDDPLQPSKVETLVRALGARVVDYPSKMQCCGGALDRVGRRDASLAMALSKLRELSERDVDALIVVCPSCFQQFDLNQAALQRAGEEVGVPVLYLAELLALCYGHAAEEIGLGMHRVSLDPFLSAWDERDAGRERAAASFDLRLLEECDGCRACKDDCPVARVDAEFRPNDIIGRILDGDLEGVLAEGQAWKCLECFTCLELCPSRIGMAEALRVLKEQAAARDGRPDPVRAAYELFANDGVLGRPRESARGKLGLPPLPASGGEALARMLASEAAPPGGAGGSDDDLGVAAPAPPAASDSGDLCAAAPAACPEEAR